MAGLVKEEEEGGVEKVHINYTKVNNVTPILTNSK